MMTDADFARDDLFERHQMGLCSDGCEWCDETETDTERVGT